MKKIIVSLPLFFLTFNIFAIDNEAFRAKFVEADKCMRQTREVTPDQDCYPKTSWAKTTTSDKKKWALCKAKQFEDRGSLYCDQINTRSAQIQSFLYKQAANAVNDPQRFNSLTQKAEETENNSIKEYSQWINDCVDEYVSSKKNLEYIENLKSDIAEGEKRSQRMKDAARILKNLEASQPKTEVIQYRGGPPITCTTVNNFTSCM
jgi:hypothetical protein